jgi:hypothetical protein
MTRQQQLLQQRHQEQRQQQLLNQDEAVELLGKALITPAQLREQLMVCYCIAFKQTHKLCTDNLH